jgi:tRNA A37 N6-isopentenylltransferase MiaA
LPKARRGGFDELHLYTHEKMSENLKIYEKVGVVQCIRWMEGRFFMTDQELVQRVLTKARAAASRRI